MKVLILGGSLFLGPILARQLQEKGHTVVLFNRGKTRSKLPAGISQVHGDRKNTVQLTAAAVEVQPDAVIDNLLYTANDAKQAVEIFGGRVVRYIAISSVAAYGRLIQIPAPETHPLYSPDRGMSLYYDEYARGKAAMEQVLQTAHAEKNFPFTTFRPSVIYGYSRIFNVFLYNNRHVSRIRHEKAIIVPDSGESLMQWVHVEDVAAAIVRSLDVPASIGQAYNICGPDINTISHYFELHGTVLNRSVKLARVSALLLSAVDPINCSWNHANWIYNHAYDLSKLKEQLDFEPTYGMERGIRETIAFQEKHNMLEPSLDKDLDDHVIALSEEIVSKEIEREGKDLAISLGLELPKSVIAPPWCSVGEGKGEN